MMICEHSSREGLRWVVAVRLGGVVASRVRTVLRDHGSSRRQGTRGFLERRPTRRRAGLSRASSACRMITLRWNMTENAPFVQCRDRRTAFPFVPPRNSHDAVLQLAGADGDGADGVPFAGVCRARRLACGSRLSPARGIGVLRLPTHREVIHGREASARPRRQPRRGRARVGAGLARSAGPEADSWQPAFEEGRHLESEPGRAMGRIDWGTCRGTAPASKAATTVLGCESCRETKNDELRSSRHRSGPALRQMTLRRDNGAHRISIELKERCENSEKPGAPSIDFRFDTHNLDLSVNLALPFRSCR